MKKKWIAIFGSLSLILFFQNCSQSKIDQADSNSEALTPTEFNKTSAADFPVVQLWDYEHGKTMDLDISTGRIAVSLNFGADRGQDLCLSAAERIEIQALMGQAEICEPVIPSEQFLSKQCTMSYRYPYAVLVDGSVEVRLGEKTNGCDVPVDLCGVKSQELQAFVSRLLQNADQRACN